MENGSLDAVLDDIFDAAGALGEDEGTKNARPTSPIQSPRSEEPVGRTGSSEALIDLTAPVYRQSGTIEQQTLADVLASKILIVDDMQLIRQLLSTQLRAKGFQNIFEAGDGAEALAMVEADTPDIVLLDINMPGMSGFEVCRELRQSHDDRSLPILMQSASHSSEQRSRVFEAGATDFVTKPVDLAELLARIHIHLSNKSHFSRLKVYRDRVQEELRFAEEMQHALLPSAECLSDIRTNMGLHLDSHWQASSELGGDLWNVYQLDAKRLAVHVFDFSGHGVSAALNTFRAHAMIEALVTGPVGRNPARMLTELNKRFCSSLPTGQFATMLYGIVDLEKDSLTFAAAAAPQPIYAPSTSERRRPDEGVTLLDTAALPLGIHADTVYPEKTVALPEGSTILLYSDALTETPDQNGNALGSEKLLRLTKLLIKGSRETLATSIHAKFTARVRSPIRDDLTIISMHRGPFPSPLVEM